MAPTNLTALHFPGLDEFISHTFCTSANDCEECGALDTGSGIDIGYADFDLTINSIGVTPSDPLDEITYGATLPDEVVATLKQLMRENRDAFATSLPKTPFGDPIDIRIKPGMPSCIVLHQYPLQPRLEGILRSLVDEGVTQSIYREVTPELQQELGDISYHPVKVVEEPTKFRLVHDLRAKNKTVDLTNTTAPPLPQTLLQLLATKSPKWLSILDFFKGYNQIMISRSSWKHFGFKILQEDGSYRRYVCTRLPFGFVEAGCIFQDRVDTCIRDIVKVPSYVDDIIQGHPSLDDIITSWRQILAACRASGLVIKPSKVKIGVTEGDWIGYRLNLYPDKLTLSADSSKIDWLANAVKPKTEHDIREFMGKLQYVRHNIRWIKLDDRLDADLIDGLDHLSKLGGASSKRKSKSAAVSVDDRLWSLVRDSLSSKFIPTTLPRFDRDVTLYTDASHNGIGGYLEQDGRPISFFSKILSKCEQRWHSNCQEFFGVITAIRQHRSFLEQVVNSGHKVSVRTDNIAAVQLGNKERWNGTQASGRWTRWLEEILPLNIEWGHIDGSVNTTSDVLSRLYDNGYVHPQQQCLAPRCEVCSFPLRTAQQSHVPGKGHVGGGGR
jgi:hypothetical protein